MHILLYSKRFAFIHIPKNAGSSIRVQVEALDETGGRYFDRYETLDGIGEVFMGHMTLAQMAKAFPDDVAALRGMETFAFTRDPLKRFISALQEFSKFHGIGVFHDFSRDRKTGMANEVLDRLNEAGDDVPSDLFHFTPQVAFLDLNGERIIKNVYPVSNFNEAIKRMSEIIGVEITPQRSNSSWRIRRSLTVSASRRLWHIARPFVPSSAKERLWARFSDKIIERPASEQASAFVNDAIADRVAHYYRRDYDLVSAVENNNQSPTAA